MQFHEFKTGQVVQFTEKSEKVIRGIVTEKINLELKILWAVSDFPLPVVYNITDVELLEKMSFYAHWHEFNTVPVKTINTLNKF